MGWQLKPLGHGQISVFEGRNGGWSKHAKFNRHGDYIGQHTKKQTNAKRKKNK
jgi:hypothetical protein